jgi:hypothetical protein
MFNKPSTVAYRCQRRPLIPKGNIQGAEDSISVIEAKSIATENNGLE